MKGNEGNKMSIQHVLNRVLCLVVLAGGLSYTRAVLASPILSAAGAKCVPEGTLTLDVTSEGEAENANSTLLTVICPAERTISPTDTTFSGVVWAIDVSQTQNVCCRAVSKNAFGSKVTSPFACSSGFSSSFQELTISSITDTGTFSQYFIECQIPAVSSDGVSGVLGYRAISQ